MGALIQDLQSIARRPKCLGLQGYAYIHAEKLKSDIAIECDNLKRALYMAANRGESRYLFYGPDNNPWKGYLPALRRGVVAYARSEGIFRRGHYSPRSGEFHIECAGW